MRWFAPALLIALVSACSTEKPPTGTPVTLTAEDMDTPTYPSKKEWWAWHTKGLGLRKEGRHQEALYCFHQALQAWPKEIPEDERPDDARRLLPHRPVPTDTVLQLGSLYIELGDRKWALHYLDEFDEHMPGNKLTRPLRTRAEGLPSAG